MVRRLYFYLVSAISLLVVTWAVIGLTRLILSEGISQNQVLELAGLLAAIIVGLPIFLFHWLMAQRQAAAEVEERASLVRRIYLYGMMLAGAVPILANLYDMVDKALLALVGYEWPDYLDYLTAGENLATILIWSVVWFYLWRQVQSDNRQMPVTDLHLSVGRLYLLLLSAGGLAMVTWGGLSLLQTLLQMPASLAVRGPVADAGAQLLVGVATWVSHWWFLQRAFYSGRPAEERSVLRKVYLYLAVFIYAVMSVFSLSALLKRLIELALGGQPSTEPLLVQLSVPLSLLVVGGVLWAYHWQVLQRDAARAPEAPRQAAVRRVYAYLVAAIGLAVLLSGLVGLFNTVIDLLTRTIDIGMDVYRSEVALFMAMTVTGLPIWLRPWRRMQRLAVLPSVEEGGERRSTVRKIYLYFFVFIASLAIFGSVGWFVYHILTVLLGADLPDDFLTQLLNALFISLLAAGVWVYHWWAIRRDGQLEKSDRSNQMAGITVLVIDGDEGQLGQAVIHWLQNDLPGVTIQSVGLTPPAAARMAGQLFEAVLPAANFIIGSWQSLTSPQVSPAVAANTALKLVVPTTERNWVWAGVRPQPIEYYARQAARGVKQAIEGEDIVPSRDIEIGTALITVGGIILLFLLLAGFIGVAVTVLD
jgi:hypothetical protein